MDNYSNLPPGTTEQMIDDEFGERNDEQYTLPKADYEHDSYWDEQEELKRFGGRNDADIAIPDRLEDLDDE